MAESPVARAEVEGVPVFWSQAEGPLRAVLFFRVGRIDESLPTNGITHLVEHLALTRVGQRPFQYNAFVEGLLTGFVAGGSEEEIVEFYEVVADALTRLPLERLENEGRILETEAAGRRSGVIDALLAVRFGARGWGLLNYLEYGLKSSAEQVEAWRAEAFTRENAALMLTGPIPGNLRLSLPHGNRRPVPPLTHPRYSLPAWMSMASPGVGIALLAERSTQLTAVLHIAERRAQSRLRYQDAVSYQVGVGYLRLDAATAHVTLFADALPDNAARVRDGLLSVMEDLAEHGPSEEELRAEVEFARKSFQQPGQALSRLQSAIASELYGAPCLSADHVLKELEGSSGAELAQALRDALPSAIAVVPNGVAVEHPKFQAVPDWSRERLKGRGRPLRAFARARANRLIVAPEGVTYLRDEARYVTIRYGELAGVLRWNDGSRTLIADNASRIHVRPADWHGGAQAVKEIDHRVPPDLVIQAGERPKPDPWAIVTPVKMSTIIRRGILWVLALFFWIVALGLGVEAVEGTGGPDAGGIAIAYAVLALICSVPLALPYLREAVRSRRPAKR